MDITKVLITWHYAFSFYHRKMPSKKIRRRIMMYYDVQIDWTEAEVFSNIDLDLSYA